MISVDDLIKILNDPVRVAEVSIEARQIVFRAEAQARVSINSYNNEIDRLRSYRYSYC